MGKKGSSPGGAVFIIVALIAAIAAIPKEVWVVIAVLVVGYLLLKAFTGNKKVSKETDVPIPTLTTVRNRGTNFRIPSPPPSEKQNAKWVPPSELAEIEYSGSKFQLSVAMVYLGSGLRSASGGGIEPALINPKLPIAANPVDESLRLTNYWPSYSDIGPEARRAYLQWLAGGRCTPNTNIGYVFLFFYGLERRALIDAKHDEQARADLPAIIAEVNQLLALYGQSNGSFRSYAANFLEYLRLSAEGAKPVFQGEPPVETSNYELPLRMRLGLGQMALNKVPVSAKWAHAWALTDPNIYKRTPVTRCEEAFGLLFAKKYAEKYGEGMLLPVNRTRLKSGYRPASAGLLGQEFTIDFGDIPDISATKTPAGRLQQLVDECAVELDSYSRFIGRNPDKKDSLEALLQLPSTLWPAPARAELDDLKSRIGDGLVVMTFGELSGRLKSAGPLTRDKVLGFARALESLYLGMEPDVLAGAKVPKAEDSIVLFATNPEDGEVRSSPSYQAAAVTIGLSYAVAAADGDVSAPELTYLSRQADSWTHLSTAHRKRLKAYLRLQMAQPTPLATFKKKLEPLAQESKRAISQFLAYLAQADGVVSREEVKLLEKLYKSLGVDSQLLYSDIQIASSPGVSAAPQPLPMKSSNGKETVSFALDAARIAALQKETDQVATLLANVFSDVEVETLPTQDDGDSPKDSGLVGLDPGHSAFLRLLLSRPTWSKQNLVDAAADMELMLEGALERINEAFFDHFDEALTEGDDPVEINQSLLEKMPA